MEIPFVYKTMNAAVKTAKREEAHIQVILAAADLAVPVEVALPLADLVPDGESVSSVSEADSVGVGSLDPDAVADTMVKVEAVGVAIEAVAEAATQYATNLFSSLLRLISLGHWS